MILFLNIMTREVILVLSVLWKCCVDIFTLIVCHTTYSSIVVSVNSVYGKRLIVIKSMVCNNKFLFLISHGKYCILILLLICQVVMVSIVS